VNCNNNNNNNILIYIAPYAELVATEALEYSFGTKCENSSSTEIVVLNASGSRTSRCS